MYSRLLCQRPNSVLHLEQATKISTRSIVAFWHVTPCSQTCRLVNASVGYSASIFMVEMWEQSLYHIIEDNLIFVVPHMENSNLIRCLCSHIKYVDINRMFS